MTSGIDNRTRRGEILVWILVMLLIGIFAYSWTRGGIAFSLLRQDTTAEEKVDSLRIFFHQLGPFASIGYVLFVVTEVVIAPIPGLLLYAPGGMIFGGFWGGTLSLIGNVLGAGVACQISRSLSDRWRDRLAGHQVSTRLNQQLERRGIWFICCIRVNPLTSSDVVSYAAGLAGMRTDRLMLGTLLGMAPLCYAQAFLSESLFVRLPQLIYPLIALTIVYVCVVFVIFYRWTLGNRASPDGESST